MSKLKDRIASYVDAADTKLLNRLPVIICINGRNFSKNTTLLSKPFCNKLSECLLSTTLKLCTEIEGAIFAYQHNDEIIIIARNDQNNESMPWFENRVQKICSATSSIATLHFNNCANTIGLNLTDEALFTSQVFTVPNLVELTNTMVYKQQQNFYSSIQFACFYELLNKFNREMIKEMLNGLSVDEKIDLLFQECGIDFNDYPAIFKRGAACYKAMKLMDDGTMKNKWIINSELPIFTKEQAFLGNLLSNGSDIYRAK